MMMEKHSMRRRLGSKRIDQDRFFFFFFFFSPFSVFENEKGIGASLNDRLLIHNDI